MKQNRSKRRAPTTQALIRGIEKGQRGALSKAITLVESHRPDHREQAHTILDACLPFRCESLRIGITGPPGVGKSTIIEALGDTILEDPANKLAVLTIDPSSSRSKGSILGDKSRMEKLTQRSEVYIRPSPSSGHLGGTSPRTHETILLCEAAGYNVIIVETVGVGQSEISVDDMVDFILLLIQPGSGDELQGMKRGIMEIADAVAVTKADQASRQSMQHAVSSCRSALQLMPKKYPCWSPHVFEVSSMNGKGIGELWQNALDFRTALSAHNLFDTHRHRQLDHFFKTLIEEQLKAAFYRHPDVRKHLSGLTAEIRQNRLTPFSGARQLIEKVISPLPPR
ncbi:MAG: methylmalonyl Co-A mutase-associated GTPase MeaB [Prosthecochloris sp.]|uniref:methylmalonyl Co-A mutase-associated GTPase MeaB n=1 Tax=Prosthecochloris sp. ZM_2 TaxID=2045206 RepID=UPI000DF786A6|nr:methylmalonyl Co-A mutase-associated GTPase MeaB [Prosthecochloris sp. ZM_2]MEC9486245.1 methylmalonyl Co-A mutase-associated GTPase MeaB [Prosthecochloris sp.]RNA65055.1 methylmalonyl Co-A mutase-associated GTPase MeaB [Prosthecochloris sp. ZM_2]